MRRKDDIIPGLAIENAHLAIKREMARKKEESEDTRNRRDIIRKVEQFLNEGNTLDEAVDLIMQDEIIHEFDYWAKNNLDIRKCIKNLVKSHFDKKHNHNNEKGR